VAKKTPKIHPENWSKTQEHVDRTNPLREESEMQPAQMTPSTKQIRFKKREIAQLQTPPPWALIVFRRTRCVHRGRAFQATKGLRFRILILRGENNYRAKRSVLPDEAHLPPRSLTFREEPSGEGAHTRRFTKLCTGERTKAQALRKWSCLRWQKKLLNYKPPTLGESHSRNRPKERSQDN